MVFGIGRIIKKGIIDVADKGLLGPHLESAMDSVYREARKGMQKKVKGTKGQITAAQLFRKLTPEQQKDLLLNNPNIVTPGGRQLYDPRTNTIRLKESPFQRNQRIRQQRLAAQLSGSLRGKLPGVSGEEVRQATFEQGRNLLQPGFDEDRRRLEQQLADQGIPAGTEAYNEQLNRLERSQASQLNQLSLGSVQQGIQTAEAQRAARFNEISSLLGQAQVGGVGFGQFQPQRSGLDLFGAEQAGLNRAFQSEQNRKNRSAQQRSALIGAIGGVGSSAIKAIWSDSRLKQNIEMVGISQSGIPVYEFDYIDKNLGDKRYRGVMAQDIKYINPEAVSFDENKQYYRVNYDLIDVDFKEVGNA